MFRYANKCPCTGKATNNAWDLSTSAAYSCAYGHVINADVVVRTGGSLRANLKLILRTR